MWLVSDCPRCVWSDRVSPSRNFLYKPEPGRPCRRPGGPFRAPRPHPLQEQQARHMLQDALGKECPLEDLTAVPAPAGSKLLPATPPAGTSWLSGQLSVLNTPSSVCTTSSLHRQAHGEGTETWGTGRPVLSLSSSGLLQGRRFWEQGCGVAGGDLVPVPSSQAFLLPSLPVGP